MIAPYFVSKLVLLCSSIFVFLDMEAQPKKWDGEAGDGLWNTATNWVTNIVPLATDDVVLDNSAVAGNYAVTLPSGNVSILVHSVIIAPLFADTIQLILPPTSTAIPAFSTTGINGITINKGGIFLNSSGAVSGTAISISDSLRINDGGRFIQRSSTGHASIVMKLARGSGTENGSFEFDVPGPASYTLSVNDRIYGNLILSAIAAGGTKSYLSTGSLAATINGEFRTGAGVNYALNFTGDFIVNGNMVHYGALNLASAPNNNILKVKKDYFQYGDITETSSGLPVIEWCGSSNQDVWVSGNISNNITFRTNNPAGVTLMTPVLLPYKLELVNGKVISTSSNLLTLQGNCSIQADSMSNNSFIDGPLKKLGLSAASYFLFPVGKGISQRWIEVNNATGDFMVEFFKVSANSISTLMGAGIDHVSRIEYWTIDAAPTAMANIELSFSDVNSGGVTDLTSLRVSQLISAAWTNAGNIATTGSAGANGSVTSNPVGFGADRYFTLASSNGNQNPLPLSGFAFDARWKNNGIELSWETSEAGIDYFEIQASHNRQNFFGAGLIKAIIGQKKYHFVHSIALDSIIYYRVKITGRDGSVFYSKLIRVLPPVQTFHLNALNPSLATSLITVQLSSSQARHLRLFIVDQAGRIVRIVPVYTSRGNFSYDISVDQLPAGHYQVFGLSLKVHTNILRFVKL